MDSISGFFSMPEADDLSRTGRLILLHESEGGYSQIWRGEKAGRFLTYKSLKKEFRGDPMYESLLRKEFDIIFSLDHPGICRCYDFRSHPELGNAIEMEWIDGVTLNEYMALARPSGKERRRILAEICDALEYIHRHQVIHRDLKPSNILITHNGAFPKIIDFGLSDTDYHAILKSGAGTPGYAAPELFQCETGGTPAVDIYSLGKIIAEVLPGKKRLIRKCTAMDPEKRCSSALQVKKALLSGRRWPLPLALFLLLAAGAAVAVYGTWSGKTADEEEKPEQSVVETNGTTSDVAEEATIEEPVTKADAARPQDVRKAARRTDAGPSADDNTIDSEELDELFKQATQIIRNGE